MKHLPLRIAVAFITFTIGTAAAYFYFILSQQPAEVIPTREDFLAHTPDDKKRTYKLKQQALGITGNNRACFITFESSDGLRFYSGRIYCKSSREARLELEKKRRRAIEIIRQEDILDDAGRKVGRKAIATFASYKGSSTVSAEILWTRGSDFGYIQGSSLESILEYEKDHRF